MDDIKQLIIYSYKFIKAEFIIFILALVHPTTQMIFLIGSLILLDTISGIYAVWKKEGKHAITSKKARTGLLPKFIFYVLAILLAQAMENQFEGVPIMKTTGFLLMSIEAKSISENYKKIFGVAIFDSLKNLFPKHYIKTKE